MSDDLDRLEVVERTLAKTEREVGNLIDIVRQLVETLPNPPVEWATIHARITGGI